MKTRVLTAAALTLLLAQGCTTYRGVTDIRLEKGQLSMQKCDLVVYLEFYGEFSSQKNCSWESVKDLADHAETK